MILLSNRHRLAAAELWAAFGGAVILYDGFKTLISRARQPAAGMLTHASGLAYPSGHTTQTIATWGIIAILLATGRPPRTRIQLMAIAASVILLVGASRIYLGTHWLTDVLGGYALGGTWLALILAFHLKRRAKTPAGT